MACGRRFTTFERVEEAPIVVVKRSGEREPFERGKIADGVRRAAKNRPIAEEDIAALAGLRVRDILSDRKYQGSYQRIAELLRDVNAQRQADLVKIDRSLGVVQNNLGVEVMKQRQSLNLLYRASQRQ